MKIELLPPGFRGDIQYFRIVNYLKHQEVIAWRQIQKPNLIKVGLFA